MESAVANLCSPGEPRRWSVSAGYFGERWADARQGLRRRGRPSALRLGRDPVAPTRPRPRAARARRERRSSSRTPRPRPASSPTSSRFAAAAREAGALSVVDAISSLGAVPLETDAWGIDVVASGAQKALMTPPGLAMVDRLARGLGEAPRAPPRRASTGTGRCTRKGQATLDAPVTPPVSLVAGAERRARDCCSRRASRPPSSATSASAAPAARALKAMGLELFSPDDDSSAVVTAVRAPDGHRLRRARARCCATATASRSRRARAS